MTATASPLTEIAAQWRHARRLYVVYNALLERYALGLPPCRDLESPVDRAQPEVIKRVWQWFAQMDERVHVHQLRQLMQTTPLGTEENLRAVIQHHLGKKEKTDADRDKVDFLLVQYLSSSAPTGFYEQDVTFEEVAELLEPLLGEVEKKSPGWLAPLKEATRTLGELNSLRDLLEKGTLEKMRKLKAGAGDKYFATTALVALTRFNFMVRRTFVRLIAADLAAVRSVLQELESRGVEHVDCSRAQLTAEEPLENLKRIVGEWKKPFRAAYAAGQNFRELIEIRAALEAALENCRSLAEGGLGMTSSGEEAGEEPASEGDETSKVAAPAHLPEDEGTVTELQFTEEINDEAHGGSYSGDGLAMSEQPAAFAVDEGYADSIRQKRAAAGWVEEPAEDLPVETPAAALPEETPASIAAQLFQGAEGSSAVTWEPVDDNNNGAGQNDAPPSTEKIEAVVNEAPPTTESIAKTIEAITEQLTSNNVKPDCVATITAKDLKLVLSSWEVGAFVAAKGDSAVALKRIVATRAVLLQQIEGRKRTGKPQGVRAAVKLAESEVGRIQFQISAAKQKKDIDGAVNLSATCKRLQTLIAEAGRVN